MSGPATTPTIPARSISPPPADSFDTAERAQSSTCASSSHRLSQQLNNSAALCIEIGLYSRAISSLQKALELNKNHKKEWKDREQEVCKCYDCTLDACIAYSETFSSKDMKADGNSFVVTSDDSKKRRKINRSPPKKYSAFWKPPAFVHRRHEETDICNKENDTQVLNRQKDIVSPPSRSTFKQQRVQHEHLNNGDDNCTGGYIYRRPIRIRCEGHAIGSTLNLIITFNLALAHHLQTVRYYADESTHMQSSERNKFVNRTLTIYELTYKWHLKLLSNSSSTARTSTSPSVYTSVTSIRFNMIIRNNLSQIHRLVGNHAKHKRCLEHLLSTVMVVTEYKSRSAMNRILSNNTKDPRVMELDGFLQNTTSLVLQTGHCANAA